MKMIDGTAMTDLQADFVRYLVLEGCTQTEAARRAGYADPGPRAYELIRKPHVQAAILAEQRRVINGDLANIALRTLRNVMEDETAPASARVSAARTSLDIGGYTQKSNQADGQRDSINDMTYDELQDYVRRGREYLDQQSPEALAN